MPCSGGPTCEDINKEGWFKPHERAHLLLNAFGLHMGQVLENRIATQTKRLFPLDDPIDLITPPGRALKFNEVDLYYDVNWEKPLGHLLSENAFQIFLLDHPHVDYFRFISTNILPSPEPWPSRDFVTLHQIAFRLTFGRSFGRKDECIRFQCFFKTGTYEDLEAKLFRLVSESKDLKDKE